MAYDLLVITFVQCTQSKFSIAAY
jgi:pentatricopeptide repeat protein